MRDLHKGLGKAKGERFGRKVLGHLKQVLKNRIDSKTEGREIHQRNNMSETGLGRPCRQLPCVQGSNLLWRRDRREGMSASRPGRLMTPRSGHGLAFLILAEGTLEVGQTE